MAARRLPPPQTVKLAGGKTRKLYRDQNGQFISKDRYLALKAQLSAARRPIDAGAAPVTAPAPTAGPAVTTQPEETTPAAGRIAAEALQQLVKLIEGRLPLLDQLLQRESASTATSSPGTAPSTVDARAEQINAADVIGRDKVTSVAGDQAGRDLHKGETFAPQITPGDWQADLLFRLFERIANRELPLLEKLIEQLTQPADDPLRSSTTELVGQLTQTILPSIEALLHQLASKPTGDSAGRVTAAAGQINVDENESGRDQVAHAADRQPGQDTHEEAPAPHVDNRAAPTKPVADLIDHIVGRELPLLDRALERLTEPSPPPVKLPLSDAERVQHFSTIKDDHVLRDELQAYFAEVRAAKQKPILVGARLSGRNLTQLDLRDVDLSRAQLARCNLSSARLDEATLVEADLEHANLEGASLRWCTAHAAKLNSANLKNADCERANLAHADLSEVETSPATILQGVNLESAVLQHSRLAGVNLSDAILIDADARWAKFSRADLRRSNLSHTRLDGADLTHSELGGADLRGARLNKTSLDGSRLDRQTQLDAETRRLWEAANLKNPADAVRAGGSFADAKLWEAQFAGLDLTQADFARADLLRADLNRADLTNVNLVEANLTEANLARARLSQARLNNACLRAARLRQANLRHADLTNADLAEADFLNADLTGANLSRANLRGARHLSRAQLDSVKSLAGAILPDGSIHR